MFENSELVERFLDYWRITGHQRIGLSYGRYEIHPDIPLGIRAVVAAIYEPPQVHYIYNIIIYNLQFCFFMKSFIYIFFYYINYDNI